MRYYPIAVRLKNQLVVIIGGGNIAERKVLNLLKSGSRVRIVSPRLTSTLHSIYRKGGLEWLSHRVKKSDLQNSQLVITATNNKRINQDVSRWAKKQRIWVNVVDQPGLSNFISVAFSHIGKAIIAVYTDGKDPALSRDLKNFMKEHWDDFLSYRRKL